MYFKKLTPRAASLGMLIAASLYVAFGLPGIMLMAAFYLPASLATGHQKAYKISQGFASAPSARTVGQVWANGGVAGLCSLGYLLHQHPAFFLAAAAALAAATADTLSSELGVLYGRRHFNILSFRKDARGRDGVVSLEGFVIGIAGSLLPAFVARMHEGEQNFFVIVLVAAFAGNLADSLLGARFERRQAMGNNAVNFTATLAASLVAVLLTRL